MSFSTLVWSGPPHRVVAAGPVVHGSAPSPWAAPCSMAAPSSIHRAAVRARPSASIGSKRISYIKRKRCRASQFFSSTDFEDPALSFTAAVPQPRLPLQTKTRIKRKDYTTNSIKIQESCIQLRTTVPMTTILSTLVKSSRESRTAPNETRTCWKRKAQTNLHSW